MPLKAKIILFALSAALFLFVLNLIIKRRLKIEHSLMWLGVSVTLLVMTSWQDVADRFAFFLGIDYPPALFFSIAIFFSLLMLFHYSVEISKLKEQNKTLNQELSLLNSIVDSHGKAHSVRQELRVEAEETNI